MIAKIFIKNLTLQCIIGCNEDERHRKQPVRITIEFWTNIAVPGSSDLIDDTVSYSTIHAEVVKLVEHSQFHLIEALSNAIAEKVLEGQRVEKVKVIVEKVAVYDDVESVGIEIEKNSVFYLPPSP